MKIEELARKQKKMEFSACSKAKIYVSCYCAVVFADVPAPCSVLFGAGAADKQSPPHRLSWIDSAVFRQRGPLGGVSAGA